MKIKTYFTQPQDHKITFDLPLTLAEIKQLHGYAAKQVERDAREGGEVKATTDLLTKLDSLINYLQSEHYTYD